MAVGQRRRRRLEAAASRRRNDVHVVEVAVGQRIAAAAVRRHAVADGAVEELVGRLGVGEVVADPAHALVTAAAETQPGDGLALK